MPEGTTSGGEWPLIGQATGTLSFTTNTSSFTANITGAPQYTVSTAGPMTLTAGIDPSRGFSIGTIVAVRPDGSLEPAGFAGGTNTANPPIGVVTSVSGTTATLMLGSDVPGTNIPPPLVDGVGVSAPEPEKPKPEDSCPGDGTRWDEI